MNECKPLCWEVDDRRERGTSKSRCMGQVSCVRTQEIKKGSKLCFLFLRGGRLRYEARGGRLMDTANDLGSSVNGCKQTNKRKNKGDALICRPCGKSRLLCVYNPCTRVYRYRFIHNNESIPELLLTQRRGRSLREHKCESVKEIAGHNEQTNSTSFHFVFGSSFANFKLFFFYVSTPPPLHFPTTGRRWKAKGVAFIIRETETCLTI